MKICGSALELSALSATLSVATLTRSSLLILALLLLPSRGEALDDRHQTPLMLQTACPVKLTPIEIALHRGPRAPQVRAPRFKRGAELITLDQDQVWLSAQLSEANRLFVSVGVCFWMRDAGALTRAESAPATRAQRTALGRASKRVRRGRIDLFIVNRLGDVDIHNAEIRGVHWRDPRDRARSRWIILSRIARAQVLAHELGHYFGLPHSAYPQSIMNKTPRRAPPLEERGFVKRELKIMRRDWRAMRGSKHLVRATPHNY